MLALTTLTQRTARMVTSLLRVRMTGVPAAGGYEVKKLSIFPNEISGDGRDRNYGVKAKTWTSSKNVRVADPPGFRFCAKLERICGSLLNYIRINDRQVYKSPFKSTSIPDIGKVCLQARQRS